MTAPPFGFRVRKGEQPVLYTRNNGAGVTILCILRGVYDNGKPFEVRITNKGTLATDRSLESWPAERTFEADGVIQAGNAGVSNSTGVLQRGQTYVEVFTSNGGVYCLAGYTYTPFAVPVGTFIQPGPGGGHGFKTIISLGDPAAGLEFGTIQTAAGQTLRVRGFTCPSGLVTDATAGNRILEIRTANPSGQVYGGGLSEPIPPSSTSPIMGGLGVTRGNAAVAVGQVAAVTLEDTFLVASEQVVFVTRNLAAADNYGAAWLEAEDWVVP